MLFINARRSITAAVDFFSLIGWYQLDQIQIIKLIYFAAYVYDMCCERIDGEEHIVSLCIVFLPLTLDYYGFYKV